MHNGRWMRRWPQGMLMGCLGLVLGSAGCATTPGPPDDDRPCFPAVLDSETAMLLRAAHPTWPIRAGDLIQTPACASQDSRDRLHETYELTR